MWIRLKIGKIRFIEDEYALMYAMKNENKIKKQGDNLIDVLEIGDIVFPTLDTTDKSIIISIDTNFVTTWSNGKVYEHEILKVITHEQYMPLAQEMKG